MEQIPSWLLVIIVAVIGWLIKNFVKEFKDSQTELRKYQDELAKELREHQIECNRVPKALIINQVSNLCEKFDEFREDAKEFREDCKEQFKVINEAQIRTNNALILLATKKEA